MPRFPWPATRSNAAGDSVSEKRVDLRTSSSRHRAAVPQHTAPALLDFVPQEILPSTTLLFGVVARACLLSLELCCPQPSSGVAPRSHGRVKRLQKGAQRR